MRPLFIVALFASVAAPAFAQARPAHDRARALPATGERVQVIEIAPDVIVGRDLREPDNVVTLPPRARGVRSLIQLRKSFTRELLASAQELPLGP